MRVFFTAIVLCLIFVPMTFSQQYGIIQPSDFQKKPIGLLELQNKHGQFRYFIDSIQINDNNINFDSTIVKYQYDTLNRLTTLKLIVGLQISPFEVLREDFFYSGSSSILDSMITYIADNSMILKTSQRMESFGDPLFPDSLLYSNWNDSAQQWFNFFKLEYKRSNRLDSLFFTSYDFPSGSIGIRTLRVFYYDSNNNLLKEVEGILNGGNWSSLYGIEYYYNSSNLYDSLSFVQFDSNLNVTQKNSTTELTYDQFNNPISIAQSGISNNRKLIYDFNILRSESFAGYSRYKPGFEGYEFATNTISIDSVFKTNNTIRNVKRYYFSERPLVAIENTISKNVLSFYPNPVSDKINIELSSPLINLIGINIYNLQGRLIFNSSINKHNHQIDISKLDPGVYIYQILNDDQNYRGKFIKQ